MSENESNDSDSLIRCNITILQYYKKAKMNRRYTSPICIRLNPEVYREFLEALFDTFGGQGYRNIGLMVEALMQLFIGAFKKPKVVQTTLFYKPQIRVEQKTEINIAQKLEVKLVNEKLSQILDSLERKPQNMDFYLAKLKEVISKAINVYQKTCDPQLKMLLERAEKWI